MVAREEGQSAVGVVELLEPRLLLSDTGAVPAVELFQALPALFAENQSQWADPSVHYALDGAGAGVAFTQAGPRFQLYSPVQGEPAPPVEPDGGDPAVLPLETEPPAYNVTVFSATFQGASQVAPIGLDPQGTVFNYFVGDQSTWREGVPTYATIGYMGLYEGTDLYVSGARSFLKYEFHLAPYADWSQIAIAYKGVDSLRLDEQGNLIIATAGGELTTSAPVLWQDIDGQRIYIPGQFSLLGEFTYGFAVTGAYDFAYPLIIDPELAWSTYLGGSSYDAGYGVCVDADGNALVTGATGSPGWTSGGFDTSYNGGNDAFVAKLSPTGQHLWSTYLGGRSHDNSTDIAVDADGNALVTGTTYPPGWTSGGFDTSYNGGADAFVAKLSPTGQHLWSTYFGGGEEEGSSGIALDPFGNALVTGYTRSPGWTSGGFDTSYSGYYDAFVVKLSSTGQHVWSTYLGGGGTGYGGDYGRGIGVDASGNALVIGMTEASGWTSGGFDTSYSGYYDAFVVKLSPTGQHLWSTYLGGGWYEWGFGIALDPFGNALATGGTNSSDWTSGGFDTTYNDPDGLWCDGFVVKLSPTGGHMWSTYLGGSGVDRGNRIAVDTFGNALVTGDTRSADWTSGGFDTSHNGGEDAFVAMLSATGSHIWSTYLGGSSDDFGNAIALGAEDNAFLAGYTYSTDLEGGNNTEHGERDAYLALVRYLGGEVQLSTIQGLVWEDFNNDGEVNFGERAIEGVTIALSGTDYRGTAVSQAVQTDANGVYAFFDLWPGEYAVTESQPTGWTDGFDALGFVNGVQAGDKSVNDVFSDIHIDQPSIAENYNFGERPQAGGTVTAGQTATIGFWQNKNGQALIRSLNGGPNSTQLGNWLAATFPNLYGANAGQNNLAGKTNAEVADFYSRLFHLSNKDAKLGGPAKLDAQAMAVALATYVTNQMLVSARYDQASPNVLLDSDDESLVAQVTSYGFLVTAYGVGVATFNVGQCGSAFGVADGSDVQVIDLLLATDSMSCNGVLYDADGSGIIDALEATLRRLANEVYTAINEAGGM